MLKQQFLELDAKGGQEGLTNSRSEMENEIRHK